MKYVYVVCDETSYGSSSIIAICDTMMEAEKHVKKNTDSITERVVIEC